MGHSSAAAKFKPGEWYQDTKQRRRVEMGSAAMSPAGRLHACLVLHSAFFGRELVAREVRGRLVPLTPRELCDEADVNRKHFSREMKKLKADGLARTEGNAKGQIRIYSCDRPNEHRSAGVSVCSGSRAERLSPRAGQSELFSADVMSWARRLKVQIPSGIELSQADIEQVEEWCSQAREADEKFKGLIAGIVTARGDNVDASDAGIVPRDVQDCHRAQPPYKEERKERNIVVVGTPPATTTTGGCDGPGLERARGNGHRSEVPGDVGTEDVGSGSDTSRRVGRRGGDRSRRADCAGSGRVVSVSMAETAREGNHDAIHGDGRDAQGDLRPDHSNVPAREQNASVLLSAAPEQNSAVLSAPDPVAAAVAAERLGVADQPWIERLCREARAAAPDITADELVWCIREKAEIVRRKKQSLGYLHTCVVNLCSPGELAQVRFRMAEDRAASNSTPSCKRCQRPLLDGHIDYICYACLEPS